MDRLLPALALIGALGIVLLGSAAGCSSLVLGPTGSRADSLGMVAHSASIMTLSVGLGLPLAWHAWRALQGHSSVAFRPRRIWLLAFLFALALLLGQAVLSHDLLPAATFPLFHLAAGTVPAAIILASVGRGLGPVATWREVFTQTASGALFAAPLAFAVEAIVLIGILLGVLLGIAAREGGRDLLQAAVTYLQQPVLAFGQSLLTPATRSPFVLTAAITVLAGVVPLVEEGVKTLGAALMMTYRKPTHSQSLLWGLAGGTGFALVEGLLNTTGAIEAWAPVVLLRVGATLLHCLAGAMTGLAWHSLIVKRRRDHGLGFFFAAVAAHGVWNALGASMVLGQGLVGGESHRTSTGLFAISILALLALVALTAAVSLLGLVRYARRRDAMSEASGLPE